MDLTAGRCLLYAAVYNGVWWLLVPLINTLTSAASGDDYIAWIASVPAVVLAGLVSGWLFIVQNGRPPSPDEARRLTRWALTGFLALFAAFTVPLLFIFEDAAQRILETLADVRSLGVIFVFVAAVALITHATYRHLLPTLHRRVRGSG